MKRNLQLTRTKVSNLRKLKEEEDVDLKNFGSYLSKNRAFPASVIQQWKYERKVPDNINWTVLFKDMSVEYFKYFGTRKDFFENEIINKKGAYRHKLIQKKLLRFSDEEIEDYLDYRFVENGCLFLRSDDNKIWVFMARDSESGSEDDIESEDESQDIE